VITAFGLAGLAIILLALSRANGEPADYYEARYPELFASAIEARRAETSGSVEDESAVAAASGETPNTPENPHD
jgi:hypothetical protein